MPPQHRDRIHAAVLENDGPMPHVEGSIEAEAKPVEILLNGRQHRFPLAGHRQQELLTPVMFPGKLRASCP